LERPWLGWPVIGSQIVACPLARARRSARNGLNTNAIFRRSERFWPFSRKKRERSGQIRGFECGLDLWSDQAQGLVELVGQRAARLGEIRPAAAFAADALRDRADELAGLELAGEVVGDGGHQPHLAVLDRREHDHARAEPGL